MVTCVVSIVSLFNILLIFKSHFQDPNFWKYRPLSELMIRAAADDVRFLLYIYHKLTEKLNAQSLWSLAIRGELYCRCFCISDNDFSDWPDLPPIPGMCGIQKLNHQLTSLNFKCIFQMDIMIVVSSHCIKFWLSSVVKFILLFVCVFHY